MKKKIYTISIAAMFLLTVLSTVSAINISSEEEAGESMFVTVDDDGQECQTASYGTIQEALDNSGNDAKIVVYPGTYYENVVIINHRVNLYSAEGPQVTKIIGSGQFTINIFGAGVKVTGFTISNTGGSGFRVESEHVQIHENIITGLSGYAIDFFANNIYVWHNDFTNCANKDYVAPGGGNWPMFDNGHCGNYYDSYTGEDADGDGIGDTFIQLGTNEDYHPLMHSWWDNQGPTDLTEITGPTTAVVGEEIQFNFQGASDPDGTKVFYQVHWGTSSTDKWPDSTSNTQIVGENYVAHAKVTYESCWGPEENYTIKARVFDLYDYTPGWSEKTFKVKITNTKPDNPSPLSGPSTAKVGRKVCYTISATDPDGHEVYYRVDWGDSDDPEDPWDWGGQTKSGKQQTLSHTYKTAGDYTIRVLVRDDYGLAADEMSTFELQVTKSRSLDFIGLNLLGKIIDNFPILARILGL